MKLHRERGYIAGMVVICLWIVFFLITAVVRCCGGSAKFGEMGDAFNILNALFAGLAFAVICSQLWLQQSQIKADRDARLRTDKIGAYATLIQLTYNKMIYERELLLKILPTFEYVSFLQEKDSVKLWDGIKAREGVLQARIEEQYTNRKYGIQESPETAKEIADIEITIPLMRQVAILVDQLQSYEKAIAVLLQDVEPDREDPVGG